MCMVGASETANIKYNPITLYFIKSYIFVAHNWSYNNKMLTIQDLRGSKCTDDEWYKYCAVFQRNLSFTYRE